MARKGTLFNDRKLAGDLRTITNRLALNVLSKYEKMELEKEEIPFAKEILLKCLGSSLPRISEISGEDGGAIKIQGVEVVIRK